MAKIFSESEKILQAKFSRGNSFSYDGENHAIVNSGKATTATGECVTDNKVENFRNYVSGALGLKDANEFKTRNIRW